MGNAAPAQDAHERQAGRARSRVPDGAAPEGPVQPLGGIATLQRTYGNQAVRRLVESMRGDAPRGGPAGGAVSSGGVTVQRSLPSVEDFQEKSSGGIFARRDDLLKEIDAALLQARNYAPVPSDLVHLARPPDPKPDYWDRFVRNMAQRQVTYQGKLRDLEGCILRWQEATAQDTSTQTERRRGAIETLLRDARAELQSTPEARAEEQAQRKEAAEKAEQELFTVERFKEAANAGPLESRAGPFSRVIDALEAYHALPEEPGNDAMRQAKLAALGRLDEAVRGGDSWLRSAQRRMAHPGFQKGHFGFQIEDMEQKQRAMFKLIEQIRREDARLTTQEERDRRAAAADARMAEHERRYDAQERRKDSIRSGGRTEGEWVVLD